MIVVVGGEKGGTGKTMIATNLAQMRTARGYDVLLIDTDKQESSSLWASIREQGEVTPRVNCIEKTAVDKQKRGGIALDLLDISKRYDDVIIDAGGRDSVELRSAVACADILITPTQPSQADLSTLGTMEEIINNLLIGNPELKSYCVINRATTNPSIPETKEAIQAIESELETISFSGVILRDRMSYKRAYDAGRGIEEMSNLDKKAQEEITQLYNFVF